MGLLEYELADPKMQTSHWWQRSATPIKSGNPFKQDFEVISPLFVRSEVRDSTLAASETPRAKSTNPFRNETTDIMTYSQCFLSYIFHSFVYILVLYYKGF